MVRPRREYMYKVLKEARESGVKFRSMRVIGWDEESQTDFEIGRITVAKREWDGEVQIGVAFCSPLDYYTNQFSKRFGQFLALGRLLKKGRRITLGSGSTEEIKTAIVALAESMEIRWMKDVEVADLV